MEWDDVETYLKRARLVWDEDKPGHQGQQLISPEFLEQQVSNLGDKIASIQKQVSQMDDPADVDTDLYRYSVPEMSDDGYCTRVGVLDKAPYDLSRRLGGESLANSRFLRTLQEIIQISFDEVSADWLGIYGRFDPRGEDPRLIKLAYRGIPSRPEFPLTELFATKSNNSKVGLTGESVIINNLEVHLRKGGAYYVCDDLVKSEACLPIFSSDFSKIIGIVDAESTEVYHFKQKPLSTLVALCLQLTHVFEDSKRW